MATWVERELRLQGGKFEGHVLTMQRSALAPYRKAIEDSGMTFLLRVVRGEDGEEEFYKSSLATLADGRYVGSVISRDDYFRGPLPGIEVGGRLAPPARLTFHI